MAGKAVIGRSLSALIKLRNDWDSQDTLGKSR
jgi:hypothetical protein